MALPYVTNGQLDKAKNEIEKKIPLDEKIKEIANESLKLPTGVALDSITREKYPSNNIFIVKNVVDSPDAEMSDGVVRFDFNYDNNFYSQELTLLDNFKMKKFIRGHYPGGAYWTEWKEVAAQAGGEDKLYQHSFVFTKRDNTYTEIYNFNIISKKDTFSKTEALNIIRNKKFNDTCYGFFTNADERGIDILTNTTVASNDVVHGSSGFSVHFKKKSGTNIYEVSGIFNLGPDYLTNQQLSQDKYLFEDISKEII